MALPPLSRMARPAATSSAWPAATTPRSEVAAVDGDVALTGSMQRRSPFPRAGEGMQHPLEPPSTRGRRLGSPPCVLREAQDEDLSFMPVRLLLFLSLSKDARRGCKHAATSPGSAAGRGW